jgi:tetratricopeptide (TPR) repeat protein
MSLRDLATDAACAPDNAAGSSSTANPLTQLARRALDAPAGLASQHHTRGQQHAQQHHEVLFGDFPAQLSPQDQLPPQHQQTVVDANALVDQFLTAHPHASQRPPLPPPPLPAYFPANVGSRYNRVPPPGPRSATAMFEAAFAGAAPQRSSFMRPAYQPLPHRQQYMPTMLPSMMYHRPQAQGQVGPSTMLPPHGQKVQEQAQEEALVARARARAREHFPGATDDYVETQVREYMSLLVEQRANPVEADSQVEQATRDWQREFAGLSVADHARSVSQSMAARGEERMEQSRLRNLTDTLANLDGSADWAVDGVSLPPADVDAEVEARGTALSWGDEFTSFDQGGEEVDATAAAAEGQFDFADAFDDSYHSDLFNYLGHDPAALQYQFGEGDSRFAGLSARQALDEGIRLRNSGQLSVAVHAFEAALSQRKASSSASSAQHVDPAQDSKEQDAEAWFLLGTTHAECDDDARGIQAFLRCVDTAREAAGDQSSTFLSSALLALGVCYTNELNTPKALAHIRQWLNIRGLGLISPDAGGPSSASPPLPAESFSEAMANGVDADVTDNVRLEHNQLVARLERAVRQDPGDVDVSIAMGVMYNLSREYEAAAEALRHAVTLRPDDARLWNKLGATLANGNESDDALRAYRKAVDLCPSFIRAWVNVGTAYANRSDLDKAARYYLKALSMHAAEASTLPEASSSAPTSSRIASRAADNDMVHVWGYLRTTLVAMQRDDLLPLVDSGNVELFRQHIAF